MQPSTHFLFYSLSPMHAKRPTQRAIIKDLSVRISECKYMREYERVRACPCVRACVLSCIEVKGTQVDIPIC